MAPDDDAADMYLEALDAHKPKRGRKRTIDSAKNRLARIDDELASADQLKRLQLIQERLDLQDEIELAASKTNYGELEKDFVISARSFSARKGISYAAWRELGVPAATLKKAGVGRATPSP